MSMSLRGARADSYAPFIQRGRAIPFLMHTKDGVILEEFQP